MFDFVKKALVDYCNWDIGEMNSRCVYAIGTEEIDERIFVVTKVYNDITGFSYHVGIVQLYKGDIIENQFKCFNTFAEARILLDMLTCDNYDVYVNDCDYGKPGEWYQDDHIGGYYDNSGHLNVCWENGTDEDFDTYFVEVQNGDGYYDSCGKYRKYGSYDDM